jgi:tetraacyldisaccharide 4'-kinase
MKTPAFWNSQNLISYLLLPFSWIYGAAALLRQRLAKPTHLPVPVICVGNLTAGGAGKTPVALYIGARLKQKGIKAFFLTRGYGGSFAGPVQVDPAVHASSEVGDEPLLLAKVLPTIVAKDRLRGADFAIAQGAEAIIMDDGLQNPALAKSLSLLVIDGIYGFGNGRLLPAGPLREPVKSGIQRADAIIFIAPAPIPIAINAMPILFARVAPTPGREVLAGKKLLAFCGLALPEKFFFTLSQLGGQVVEKKAFADHHPYTKNELATLTARAKALEATLVTTAKDAVRLPPEFLLQVTVVDISLLMEETQALDALLNQAMKAA